MITGANKSKLWQHQQKAIEIVNRYLRSGSKKASLIQIPTGAGKTGIIAVAACFFPAFKNILIVTPRKALRDQIIDDIKNEFWITTSISRTNAQTKDIEKLLPQSIQATLNAIERSSSGVIAVTTFQALDQISREQKPQLSAIQKKIDLVLVDEGHYEPANKYAKLVRTFKKPVVLFSATPYRSDFKRFDVDEGYCYFYSFHEAVKDKRLRAVALHKMACSTGNIETFVDEVIEYVESNKALLTALSPDGKPKIIIRADTEDGVRAITQKLLEKRQSVIGIHENFTTSEAYRSKTLPVRGSDLRYWVHQHKLLEGVDDPNFVMVVIFSPFIKGRSLIQQVGRIVRNKLGRTHKACLLYTATDKVTPHLWGNYLAFDASTQNTSDAFKYFNFDLKKFFSEQQPAFYYVENSFRTPFSLSSYKWEEDIVVPKSVTIWRINSKFSMNNFCNYLAAEFDEKDRAFHEENIDSNTRLFVFYHYANSPILKNSLFIEASLGATIVKQMEDHLFFYDSHSFKIDNESIPGLEKREIPENLKKVFVNDKNARIKFIALKNADIGNRSVRAKSLSAFSIEETAPALGDHHHIIGGIRGRVEIENEDRSMLYVGVREARIRMESAERITILEYFEWLNSLKTALKSRKRSHFLNARYAEETANISKPSPKSILIDIDSDALEENAPFFEDLCVKVTNNKFQMKITNGKAFDVGIEYSNKRKKYILSSDDLQAIQVQERQSEKRISLLSYLNREQCFTVVPEEESFIYAHGAFYNPRLKLGKNKNNDGFLDVTALLEGVPALASNIDEEKIINANGNIAEWESRTLFNLIDNMHKARPFSSLMGEPDILVCDDMNTESCDFIAVSKEKERVAFIHGKVGDGALGSTRLYSVSALHDVVSQAMKNLFYLSSIDLQKPPNDWSIAWETSKTINNPRRTYKITIDNRIRRGVRNSDKAWREIKQAVVDPNVNKEVWVMLGRLLSKQKVESRARKDTPDAETIQLHYLLTSLWNACQSCGARLRIFCNP